MIELRPYQADLVRDTGAALRQHRSVLLQLPTGGGKTALAAHMLGRYAETGKRAIFCCHRIEILEQACEAFESLGIPFGVVAPGKHPNPYYPIHICSIDTLRARIRRGKSMPPADLVCIDEGHHAVSPTWQFVLNHYAAQRWLFLSATPERMDGRGLGDVAETMICGPTVEWLIQNGYLAQYDAYAPSAPDLAGTHTARGDYVQAEVEAKMDKPSITGDAIGHYLKICPGKRAIAFCVSIKHSKHVAQQFQAAGVLAMHVDGETPRDDRRAIMDEFRRNEIQVLTSVDIFGEGVDVPGLDASILLRPTKSLGLCLQQIGRCLRATDGKRAIILDHAGNLARHGLPDDEREWTLDGRKAKKRGEAIIAVKTCPQCFACHRPAPACPTCGFRYEIESREVIHVDGVLAKVDKDSMRRMKHDEEKSAKTLGELIALGTARQYQNPIGWAHMVIDRRNGWRLKPGNEKYRRVG